MRLSVTAVLVSMFAASCGNSSSATLDGTWVQSGVRCDGTAQTLGDPVTLVISGSTGSLTFGDSSCRVTETLTYSQPSSGSLTLSHSGSYSCVPADCDSVCSSTTPNPDETFSYTLSGNTLAVSRTQTSSDGDCAQDQTVEYTLTRQ